MREFGQDRVVLVAKPRALIRKTFSLRISGLCNQFHQKIFGLFQRLHSHDAYPGTGIGLALVRKGVERMGGQIGLESEVGVGTRFWFQLPAATMACDTERHARDLETVKS